MALFEGSGIRKEVSHVLSAQSKLICREHERPPQRLDGLDPAGGNDLYHTPLALHDQWVLGAQRKTVNLFASLQSDPTARITERNLGRRIEDCLHESFGALVADPARKRWTVVNALALDAVTRHATQRSCPA